MIPEGWQVLVIVVSAVVIGLMREWYHFDTIYKELEDE